MTEYLIQDATMQAIADPIKDMIGATSALTPNQIGNAADEANTEVSTQADLMSQIVTALEGKGQATIPDGYVNTSDATATANDMAEGVTAYVKGEMITGAVKTYASQAGWTVSPKLSDNDANLLLSKETTTPYLFRAGAFMRTALTNLGDATADDVAAGKTFTSAAGLKVSGTHECASPSLQSKTVTPSESQQTVSPDSGYDGLYDVTVEAVSKTYVGSGVTKKSAATYTPGTSDQTIASGQYLSGKQTIKGDTNLLAENIKSGVSIFGVDGTYEGSDIETFYITSTTDTITPKGSGTVKVWGYGFKSSDTYSKTTYAFVGDGYYTASSYGTPSKTSATFGINSDGTLSGLPSNVSTVDLLVTIGI